MKCSEVERILPDWLDGGPELASSEALTEHLEECPACADLVSDLRAITSQALELSATEEPAPRLWVKIAAQLRAEGIIREESAARPVLVPSSARRRWSAWWLAPVAAGVLAAASYVASHKTPAPVANQVPPQTQAATPAPITAAATPATAPKESVVAPTPAQTSALAASTPKPRLSAPRDTEATADADDQQFLSAVSTLPSSMRITYENQLRTVNADIRETEEYIRQYPGDMDARQHLMDAYQQKALLYQIALDRVQ